MELLVAMAIFFIVGFASTPYVSELMESFTKRNAEMQLLGDMRLAQATAVEQGCQGIININADHSGYTFGCDYVPFSAASPPVIDTLLFTRYLPSKIEIESDALIIFNTRGQSVEESGSVATRQITLTIQRNGSNSTFNTGTLRPTGFFSFAS